VKHAKWPLAVVLGVGVLVSAGWLAGAAQKDDKGVADLPARIKAAVGADKPFTLIVTVKLKDGTKARFEEQAAKTTRATAQEKGCILYEFTRDLEKPNVYTLYEKWASVAALEAHLKMAHTEAVLKLVGEIAAEPPTIQLYSPPIQ
jgi:quinol monooxygenase YgiN